MINSELRKLKLIELQKEAKKLEVLFDMSTKKSDLLKLVLAANVQATPSTMEGIITTSNLKTLKQLAKDHNIKLKAKTNKEGYVSSLLEILCAEPVDTKPTAVEVVADTVAEDKLSSTVKLKQLDKGSKFSFIRAGKVCKAIYTLIDKRDKEAVCDDAGELWTAKILNYTVMPIQAV